MAAREAWRPCFAWLNYALGDLDEDALPEHLRNRLVTWPVLVAYDGGINSPIASSAGRLLDAVACLLGVAGGYRGQAPMRLEMSAEDSDYHRSGAYGTATHWPSIPKALAVAARPGRSH